MSWLLTAIVALGACGGEPAEESAQSSTEPSPSEASPPDDPSSSDASPSGPESELADLEELGALVAGDPTDLVWQLPQPPDDWQQLEVQEGIVQWQVGERCAVTADQPAGLDERRPDADSEQILREYAGALGANLDAEIEVLRLREVMLPLVVVGQGDTTGSVKAARAELAAPGLGGEIITYRSGDFALILMATCGDGQFPAMRESDFAPFADEVAVAATY